MADSSSYEKGYQQQPQEKHSDQLRDAGHAKPILRHQLAQFQRTERSQRNKDPEPEVEAEYTKGQGGKVKTLSKFGKAHLFQEFIFGPDGDLTGINVEKRLNRGFLESAKRELSGHNPYIPEMGIRLAKGEDGKFEVIKKNSTPDLQQWEEAFTDYLGKKVSPQPRDAKYDEYQQAQHVSSGSTTENKK